MIWLVLMIVVPAWIKWHRRKYPPQRIPVSRNTKAWRQPTPWALDLDNEDDTSQEDDW